MVALPNKMAEASDTTLLNTISNDPDLNCSPNINPNRYWRHQFWYVHRLHAVYRITTKLFFSRENLLVSGNAVSPAGPNTK